MPLDPVSLSQEQIQKIVDEIPDPMGSGKTNIAIAKRHLDQRLSEYLSQIKLVPTDAAFEMFKEKVIEGYYQSLVEPGAAVGVNAATSIVAPATQMSLNTSHFAGSIGDIAIGFLEVNALLTGRQKHKDVSSTIFFRERSLEYPGDQINTTHHTTTFDEVLAKRPEFEQTTVQDLVVQQGATIIPSPGKEIHQLLETFSSLYPDRFSKRETRFPLSYVLRVELDRYRMFTHRITMSMVADAIQGPPPLDIVRAIWEPQEKGVLYVFLNETKDMKQDIMDHDDAIQVFLRNKVMLEFDNWNVSGINGIRSIVPSKIDVVDGIRRTTPHPDDPERMYVWSDHHKTRWVGISLADLFEMCGESGLDPDDMDYENLKFSIRYDNKIPLKKWIRGKPKSSFYIAKARGNNMEALRWREDVDHFHTYVNQPHDVAKDNGIDATLVYLISIFRETLGQFGYSINSRHIGLMFSLMCNLGLVNGLTSTGIKRRRIGPLAAASTDRSMLVFMNRSTFGANEAITGVSEAIYTGQHFRNVGTGSVQTATVEPPLAKALPYTTESDLGNVLDGIEEDPDYVSVYETFDKQTSQPPRQPIDEEKVKKHVDILEQAPPAASDLLPPRARIVLSSPTLRNALSKVTKHSGLDVEQIDRQPQVTEPAIDLSVPSTKPTRATPFADVKLDLTQDIPFATSASAASPPQSPPRFPGPNTVDDLLSLAPNLDAPPKETKVKHKKRK